MSTVEEANATLAIVRTMTPPDHAKVADRLFDPRRKTSGVYLDLQRSLGRCNTVNGTASGPDCSFAATKLQIGGVRTKFSTKSG